MRIFIPHYGVDSAEQTLTQHHSQCRVRRVVGLLSSHDEGPEGRDEIAGRWAVVSYLSPGTPWDSFYSVNFSWLLIRTGNMQFFRLKLLTLYLCTKVPVMTPSAMMLSLFVCTYWKR